MGRQGAFFWMVKPGAFGDQDRFGAYMSAWTRTYLDAGAGKGKLPGSRGARLEQEGRERGIELSGAIGNELTALGRRLSVPFPG
jgi:LDH2 family malate/lactate/ureidoglycolate dehydrogenase